MKKLTLFLFPPLVKSQYLSSLGIDETVTSEAFLSQAGMNN